MTVDIAKVQLSQQKSVHMLGVLVAPISVDMTDVLNVGLHIMLMLRLIMMLPVSQVM